MIISRCPSNLSLILKLDISIVFTRSNRMRPLLLVRHGLVLAQLVSVLGPGSWSRSLVPVPVPSYFRSRSWSRSWSHHISGLGLGPGLNFWSRQTVYLAHVHVCECKSALRPEIKASDLARENPRVPRRFRRMVVSDRARDMRLRDKR